MKPELFPVAALIVCGSALAQTLPPVPSKIPGGGPLGSNGAFTNETNVESYASFAAALTAIGSSTKTLVIASIQKVSASVTTPATCTLEFAGTGKLVVASGQTLTITRRPIAPPNQQIFDTSASGAWVSITEPDGPMPLRWWGLYADGRTDDAPIIQSALNGAVAQGTRFLLPDETTVIIRSTIKVSRPAGATGLPHGIGIIGSASSNNYQSSCRMKWDGAAGGTMIAVKNEPGFYLSGFQLQTENGGSAAAIILDMDQEANVSCNVTTTAGSANFTATGGLQGYGNMAGRTISIPGAGARGKTLVTTIARTSTTTSGVLAVNAGRSVSNVAVTIPAAYSFGTMTRALIENMQFTNNPSNPNLVIIRVAYYSGQNNEHHTIRHCILNQQYQSSTNSNASRGIGISIGSVTGGGGSNAFNTTIEDNEISGLSTQVSAVNSASGIIRNNLGEFGTTSYAITAGAWIIEDNRNENDRQFLKDGGSANYTIIGNEIAHGTDTDVTKPLLDFGAGGWATLIGNYFNSGDPTTFTPVKCTVAGNNFTLISLGNNYNNTNTIRGRRDFASFHSYTSELDSPVGQPTIEYGSSSSNSSIATNLGTYNFQATGGVNPDVGRNTTFLDGTSFYATDGTPNTNPATGKGTGAVITKINGTWVAPPITTSGTTTGGPLHTRSGRNATVGSGRLSGGTVTISNTSVASNSKIFLQNTASSLTNVGTLSVSSKTTGKGFVVTSSNALDTSTFDYWIVEADP